MIMWGAHATIEDTPTKRWGSFPSMSLHSLRKDLVRAKADLADAENAEWAAKKKQEDACMRILSIEAQLKRGVDQLSMGRMEELVDWAIKRADEVGEETKPMVLVDKFTNHVHPRVTRHGEETHKRYLVNEGIWFSRFCNEAKKYVPRKDKLLVARGHEHTMRRWMGGVNEENTTLIEISYNQEFQVYTVKLGHDASYNDTKTSLSFDQAMEYLIAAMV